MCVNGVICFVLMDIGVGVGVEVEVRCVVTSGFVKDE